MADQNRRIAIGFQGGQSLALKLPDDALTKLRDALNAGADRWHETPSADGAVMLDLGQIVYLRVESDEHRIGF
jgi:hypothetical protein